MDRFITSVIHDGDIIAGQPQLSETTYYNIKIKYFPGAECSGHRSMANLRPEISSRSGWSRVDATGSVPEGMGMLVLPWGQRPKVGLRSISGMGLEPGIGVGDLLRP